VTEGDIERSISVTVNGRPYRRTVPVRTSLADFLRHELRLTGTHVGCEQGQCGACTVLLDGAPVRGCLLFAVQADGAEIGTVESLAAPNGELHPVQQAFWDQHGLQCGFCTPGILLAVVDLLRTRRGPPEDTIRKVLAGHVCRCTGYQNIVRAVQAADRAWTR
jgi:carbon-monoxide dehydrogenase small subunit